MAWQLERSAANMLVVAIAGVLVIAASKGRQAVAVAEIEPAAVVGLERFEEGPASRTGLDLLVEQALQVLSIVDLQLVPASTAEAAATAGHTAVMVVKVWAIISDLVCQ